MRELILNSRDYKFVPHPAEDIFENNVSTWYYGHCEDNTTPHLLDNLLNDGEGWALHFLMHLHNEFSTYHFALENRSATFDHYEYPVDKGDWTYEECEDEEEYFYENHSHTEMLFYMDMKEFLNSNYMFYLDSYAGEGFSKKIKIINPPIKGVW